MDFMAQLHPQWQEALAPLEANFAKLDQFLTAEHDSGAQVLPARAEILRAFSYPLNDVKALIVGQDPYPTAGHPMGLSFAVHPGVPIPRSLANIFTELQTDLGIAPPNSGDLRPWCEQGVMLLNRVLTVRAGEAGSHRGRGWEEITQAAVQSLCSRDQPLVAILWGNQARSLLPLLQGTPVITSAHPSPLSARRGFFGSRPFSRANESLTSQGALPVTWQLPTDTLFDAD